MKEVDTRHNGGGWLHDDVVTLLSGKEYQRFVPRGQYIGSQPERRRCTTESSNRLPIERFVKKEINIALLMPLFRRHQ
ncbi:hypothetical protein [Bacteroides sp.]|uniref:hypothetical protein n=1 Tax=Bacteroides sp. TaxID=29523 RepID=UPI00402554DE